MQLCENGMINLDENINNYFPAGLTVANPYFPEDTIAVRMLMIHTSSIQQNWNVINQNNLIICGDSPIRLDSFLVRYFTPGREYYRTGNFYNYSPGTQWNYSNLDYDLLALMVENLTGKSFEEYSRDSILTPLSMNSSSWFLEGMDINQIATPYEGSSPVCHQGAPDYPEGFLRSNKMEMLNYLLTYLNYGKFNDYRILDSATIAYMLSDQLGYPAVMELPWFTYTQGLSWWHVFPISNYAWGRGGSWNGYLAYVSFEPDEKWCTIWFQNQRPVNSIVGKIGEINYPFSTYAHYYGNVYAVRPSVINPYAEINKDSVLFRTSFSNIYNHQFTPHLICTNSDSTKTDSLILFDDGLHNDLISGDGIYGGYIPQQSSEDFFSLGVSTIDQSNKYFNTPNIAGFTTAGPITVDSVFITKLTNKYQVKLDLRNKGQSYTVKNLQINMTSRDGSLDITQISAVTIASIVPGEVKAATGSFFVEVDSNFTGIFCFDFRISSNGYVYWIDSDTTIVTGVETKNFQPLSYQINQNYPNPFNPSTTIGYQLAKGGKVTLKVYNVLGKEIVTLVNEYKPAGEYEINWNAADLPSGVYFYQLQAGEFIETKKMVLLR